MRTARVIGHGGTGYYHCMSRIIDDRCTFNRRDKEKFTTYMRNFEEFCGVKILTYSILSNHWHILVKIPERQELSDTELIRRLHIIYGRTYVSQVQTELQKLREEGNDARAEALKQRYTYRMWDLSEFIKALKQSFTMYYNKKHRRRGTLWDQRFKSILVENSTHALSTMAAYIDLNAVRAGLVSDPKDYRWCGYGEAMGGSKVARAGLGMVMEHLDQGGSWRQTRSAYRRYVYSVGEQRGIDPEGRPVRAGFSSEQVAQVLEAGGKLPLHEMLRCRVRYFSDGVVLGSKGFVEDVFGEYRDEFGLKRESGARSMKYAEWDGLCTMRDLRKAVIFVPQAP